MLSMQNFASHLQIVINDSFVKTVLNLRQKTIINNCKRLEQFLSERCILNRFHSTRTDKGTEFIRARKIRSSDEKPLGFDDLHIKRRGEANRSILVQIRKGEQTAALLNHCRKYGDLNRIISLSREDSQKMFLIEFAQLQSALDLMAEANFFSKADDSAFMSYKSRHLYYHCVHSRTVGNVTKLSNREKEKIVSATTPDVSLNSAEILSKSLSDQMEHLHIHQRQTDSGSRLRYFLCRLVEDRLSALYKGCQVLPFGSSVNGFGKLDCDLDMMFEPEESFEPFRGSENRFLFKSRVFEEERDYHKNILDLFSKLLFYCMPTCINIQRILHARIPIIKFDHVDTNLQCDLSFGNRSGVYMSELFHIFGELDRRVRPLVFTIRHWARLFGLTSDNPGEWITNYQLTLLILYFLQICPKPVLPSVDRLKKLADLKDRRYINGEDFTFVRDIRRIPQTKNRTDCGELLMSFFKFYADFDFSESAISLIHADTFTKPEDFPLYLQNPLQPELNTSKNVSTEELDKFQIQCVHALRVLEHSANKHGLIELFQTAVPKTNILGLDMKSLFDTSETGHKYSDLDAEKKTLSRFDVEV